MTSNHSHTVSVIFFPDQNHPRNPKTPKLSQIDSCRLTGVHHRQAIQTEPRKLGDKHVSSGDHAHAARQFLFRNPEPTPIYMSRLAAMNCPPGDFWKFFRNTKIAE